MTDDKSDYLKDWNRLQAGLDAFGQADGATVVGNNALKAARRALVLLQMGVLKSSEPDQEPVKYPTEI